VDTLLGRMTDCACHSKQNVKQIKMQYTKLKYKCILLFWASFCY